MPRFPIPLLAMLTLAVMHIPAQSAAQPAIQPAIQPATQSAAYAEPVQGDYTLRDFQFASGEQLAQLRIHYRTLGRPQRDAHGVVRNAVLITHGTGGTGAQFLRPEFAGELFGAGGVLDAARYYIILTDGIGHGQSSKPSDGLRARFPHYGYNDMVDAQYRLLREGLGVDRLRLVMGTSMGGMQAWIWGQRYPRFMDALMPLASVPAQISGRNRVWRRVVIDAIRHDPAWKGGDYAAQPPSLRTGLEMLYLMGSNTVLRQRQSPTLAAADAALDSYVAAGFKNTDATDLMYQLQASQDYDPAPGLEQIEAPLLALNTADDLINPPELLLLEREIGRVRQGQAVVLPFTDATAGHGSHTIAALWQRYLRELLARSGMPEK